MAVYFLDIPRVCNRILLNGVFNRYEILPLVTVWMDLEGINLSEISQPEKGKMPYDFTYMWNLKNNLNEQVKQKQAPMCR